MDWLVLVGVGSFGSGLIRDALMPCTILCLENPHIERR
jgi:hypothetical protein